jgi:hypothetical protein
MPGRLQAKVRADALYIRRETNISRAVRTNHRRWIVNPSLRHTSLRGLNEVTLLLFLLNSGIGLESSLLFASEGANVLLVDINLKATEAVAALIAARYPNVKAVVAKADVGVEKEIKDAVDLAVREFGRLDVMVRLPSDTHPPE